MRRLKLSITYWPNFAHTHPYPASGCPMPADILTLSRIINYTIRAAANAMLAERRPERLYLSATFAKRRK